MKKTISIILVLLLTVVLFAACGEDKDQPMDSSAPESSIASTAESAIEPASDENAAGDDSSMPEPLVDRNPYPGQTSMGGKELTLVMFSADPETEPPTIKLSLQQQNGIAQELQSVMARYASGEYPVEPEEGDEGPGFYPGWPNGVDFPKTAPVKQLIFSTVGHEAYPMSVQVALSKGWFMECALVVQAEEGAEIDFESEENTWVPVTAHFIDPNGLVRAEPGETDIEGGITVKP